MSDPWEDLEPPSVANAINARRVDAECPWGFFWARSIDDRCLFVVQHDPESAPTTRLPRLQGIEVSESDGPDGVGRVLVFKLHESVHRELFHRLCLDVLSCAARAETEKEMVHIALARTWRWHHLLRGGGDQRLTPEEQKGLIGELLLIERHLLHVLSAGDAVTAWVGPLGAPKDFQIGQICIEVKTRRGGAAPSVKVSSESQLDEVGLVALFLFVTDLDRAPVDSGDGLTLTDVALRVRAAIEQLDAGAIESFESALVAAGFRWTDDYSDTQWLEGAVRIYRIAAGFPRLAASQIPAGVSTVKYAVSLVECDPFSVDAEEMEMCITGGDVDVD
jgi:Putative  PD-(D/E)XK family member, (DUF4420)